MKNYFEPKYLNPVTIGINLRNLRNAAGISQEQLSEEINICRSAIGKIESGKQALSLEAAYNISRLLGIPIEDLVKEDLVKEEKKPTNEPTLLSELKELINKYE